MSTKSLRKLVELFGGVPLAHYTTEKMDREAHEAWAGAKTELEAIEKERREAFLQGLRIAAGVVAEHGGDVMPASDIYERLRARIAHETQETESEVTS